VAAAAGNDPPPILGVPFECISLERINLVTDDTGHGHEHPPGGESGRRSEVGGLVGSMCGSMLVA